MKLNELVIDYIIDNNMYKFGFGRPVIKSDIAITKISTTRNDSKVLVVDLIITQGEHTCYGTKWLKIKEL